jgi:integrase
MRKMEILKLTWGQVDLQRGLIHLSDTKNGERRAIPIAGHAFELISQLPHRSQYVFPTRTGNYPIHINDAWYPMIQKTGIQDFRFHDLRYTAASYMAMQGVPLLTIGTILGHKNLEVTRRYAHLNTSHLRGVLGNLNDMMFPDV